MPYPLLPADKQYPGTLFPQIAVRAVPSDDEVSQVEQAPLALHGDGGDSSSEALGPPKKMDMGALRVWLEGGERTSKTYDDGPSFDYVKHGVTPPPDSGEDGFNFAPGSDEGSVSIGWEIYGLPNIKSAKLELFASNVTTPIWQYHWGNAWGKKTVEISDFSTKSSVKTAFSAKGSLPFTTVKIDTAVQGKGADGKSAAAFPKALLTAARSPYQLRLTVSGCTDANTPADGDKLVYPMTAWTYLHVLLDGFNFKFGDPKWLKARTDIDPKFKDLISGSGSKKGLEELLLSQLRGFVTGDNGENMSAGTRHLVALPTAYNKRWDTGKDYEFDVFKDMWGNGPRIPLVASARIRKLDKSPTTDHAADVMAGAGVLWDWHESDPKRIETLTGATPTVGDGTLSAEFLKKILKESSTSQWPTGSFNCPKTYGGKHGDDPPIFDKGPDDYKLVACKARTSAVITTFDDKGESAVIFCPSRFAGDNYQIDAYLYNEAWMTDADKQAPIVDPPTAVGSPGVFTVYRKITAHHLVIGNLPGLNAKTMRDDVVKAARDQAGLLIEFVAPDLGDFATFMNEVNKNFLLNTKRARVYSYAGIEFPTLVQLNVAGDWLFKVPPSATFIATLEALFRSGAMRICKKSFDLEKDGFGRSAQVLGRTNASPGYLLDLGTQMVDGSSVVFAIAEPGHVGFVNGETVDVVNGGGKSYALQIAKPCRSCWRVAISFRTNTALGKTVRVRIPNQPDTDLQFARSGALRNYASTLSDAMKNTLRQAFVAAANGWDDSGHFKIVIEGDQSASTRSKGRVDSTWAYLQELCATEIVERGPVYEAFKTHNGIFFGMDKGSFAAALFDKQIYGLVTEAVAYTYAKKNNVSEGLIIVHSSRMSSLSSNADDAIGTKVLSRGARGDYTDFNAGGYVDAGVTTNEKDKIGLSETALQKLSLIQLITPDPNAVTTYRGRAVKKSWAVMLHELGHALWLNHAKGRPGEVGAESIRLGEHVADESCIMSYDSAADQLCGLCMIRLRGWRWKSVKRELGDQPRTVTLRLGNVESIFADAATTPRGKLERLQVLGLFNRPLDLEGDKDFGTEFEECREYSWRLANELLPGLEDNPQQVFNQHLQSYLISGGMPATDGEARLRVFGHYHPFYANMDMALRYLDATKKDARENQFKMMAIRGDVEAMTQGANPAIGVFPIEVLVTDAKGDPAPDEEVWIELIAPKASAATFDKGFAGERLLGATNFVKGVVAPAFDTPELAHVKKWIDDNVVKHDASADDDPQKGNVHYEMGGKRRLRTDGNVVTPDAQGFRNVFTVHAGNAVAPKDGAGKEVPHAILLKTDMDGVARFLFTPSTVGGDAYRLKATVHEGDDKKEVGKAESGNLVVWRTHRVGGYWQLPNAANERELTPSMSYYMGYVGPNDRKVIYTPLPAFDLKTSVGFELARSYCEVLFEDAALRPTPLPRDYWAKVGERTRLYDKAPVELVEMFIKKELPRLPLAKTGEKTYSGTLTGQVRAWNVGVMTPSDGLSATLVFGFAQIDPKAAYETDVVPLVALKVKDPVFSFEEDVGLDSPVLMANKGVIAVSTVEAELASGTFKYSTNEITVKLAKDFVVPKPKLNNANDQWFGKVHSVTGATINNTDEGALYLRVQKNGSKWDVLFFKDAQRRKEDLVAAAKGKKASTGDAVNRVRATEQNKSGLSVDFDMGVDPRDKSTTRMWAELDCMFAFWAPLKPIDREAVIANAERSPWLFNFKTPNEYNRARDPSTPAAPQSTFHKTWFDFVVGSKSEHTFSETVLMRSASGALRGGQGNSYYPGQLYLHANYCNPMSMGLRGKGTGNTAFLFNESSVKPELLHYLALHETGHCLYGIHSWKEAAYVEAFHDPSHAMVCIMAGAQDLEHDGTTPKSLRTFCGKCNAALRGVLVMEPPLYPTSESGKPDMPKPGDAKTARRPKLGSVTGGMILPTPPTLDPHPPLPTPKPTDVDNVVLDAPLVLDDDTDVVVVVDLIPQEKSLWCWAATSQMMRKYFKKETITQSNLAREATGNDNDQEYALPLVGLDSDPSGEGNALSFEQIKGEIDNDRPFIFGNSRHYMVVYGYRAGSREVLVYDPLPINVGRSTRLTYDNYRALIETGEDGRRGANYYNIRKR